MNVGITGTGLTPSSLNNLKNILDDSGIDNFHIGTKSKTKKPSTKSTKAKTKRASKTKGKSKNSESFEDIGVIVVDDDLTVDKEKELEERRAFLEEARSQDSSD